MSRGSSTSRFHKMGKKREITRFFFLNFGLRYVKRSALAQGETLKKRIKKILKTDWVNAKKLPKNYKKAENIIFWNFWQFFGLYSVSFKYFLNSFFIVSPWAKADLLTYLKPKFLKKLRYFAFFSHFMRFVINNYQGSDKQYIST